jgi:hypothetical protein
VPSIEEQWSMVAGIAGIEPSADDLPALLLAYETGREQAALVHGVAEARYEEPGLVFSARLAR